MTLIAQEIKVAPIDFGNIFLDQAIQIQMKRIEFLLSKKYPTSAGPNCWNAALYVQGYSPGVYYSSGWEMPFWFNSPLCKISPKYQSGDLVNISALVVSKDDYLSSHTYNYLNDTNGFTKDGPDKKTPYKISAHQEISNFYGLTNKECQNISPMRGVDLQCKVISTNYHCQSLQSKFPFIAFSKHYIKLNKIAKSITERVFSKENEQQQLDLADLKDLRQEAKMAISLPDFSLLPTDVQQIVKSYFPYGNQVNNLPYSERIKFLNEMLEIVFLNAYPGQHLSVDNSSRGKLIKEFRSKINYPNISAQEFYKWAYILHNSRGMLDQEDF